MHLLEETTVRTEWTRAPGTVDAYEIQFIPTVRAQLQEEVEWAGLGGGSSHLKQEVLGSQVARFLKLLWKAFLSYPTLGPEGLCSISSLLLEYLW